MIPLHANPSTAGMKVLFDHSWPFMLAHGGFQIQIEQTKAALENSGLKVEMLRWWDDRQTGEVIHYFGRPTAGYIDLAHRKGLKVVMAELLTGLGSRSPGAQALQKVIIRVVQKVLPGTFSERMAWNSYQLADACIANTPYEAQLMVNVFSAPPLRVHCVPNGVEEVFLDSPQALRGPWLICTATITERKRVVELAKAAVAAQTPLWIVGKPYSESDTVARQFRQLVNDHSQWLRYEGAIQDRKQLATVYREARGFVLFSVMETRSLAAEEAAACGCPLLLSDLPWARSVFGEAASYCPIMSPERTARILRSFYDRAPSLPPPPTPLPWIEVAGQIKSIYQQVLSTSR
jgi:glycosyltransferase involved in cell wall biosynthesis